MELTSHVSPSHPTGVETVTFAFRTRDQLLQSLAARITDDRQGESPPRTPGDVDRWLRQRSEPAQQAILAEMDHVLSRVYISRQACEKALAHVVTSDTLALPSPGECWRKVNFRRIQDQGERQRVMLSLVEEALQKETGLTLTPCGSPDGPYVYLDDGVFTGTSVRWDIIAWVKTDPAPKVAKVPILTVANHRGRIQYTKHTIPEEARGVNKDITAEKWAGGYSNRRSSRPGRGSRRSAVRTCKSTPGRLATTCARASGVARVSFLIVTAPTIVRSSSGLAT